MTDKPQPSPAPGGQFLVYHRQNIEEEGELKRRATHKDFLSVRLAEGVVSPVSVVKKFFTTAGCISHETAQARAEKTRRTKP